MILNPKRIPLTQKGLAQTGLALALCLGALSLEAQSIEKPSTTESPVKKVSELEALRQEAIRRNNALVGYSYTYGFSLKPKGDEIKTLKLHSPSAQTLTVSFWMESLKGPLDARLLGQDGKALFSFQGIQSENTFTCEVPEGPLRLEIDASKSNGGYAHLGVKGSILTLESLDARASEIPADPSKGFHWPYILYLPEKFSHPCLLVRPINTGFATTNIETLRLAAIGESNDYKNMADSLECPLLLPIFPRPTQDEKDNLYLHALTRESLLTEKPEWKRVDLQLLAMIQDAKTRLNTKGFSMHAKSLFWGFSASGSFVTRFSMIHPQAVLAAATVAGGAWPIAPTTEWEGEALTYPVGLSDLEKLTGKKPDMKAIKALPRLLFRGEKDTNDDAIHRDSYSKLDEEFLFKHFGDTPLSRWKKAQKIYAKQGLNARFVFMPDTGHDDRPAKPEIFKFFKAQLEKAFGNKTPISNTQK